MPSRRCTPGRHWIRTAAALGIAERVGFAVDDDDDVAVGSSASNRANRRTPGGKLPTGRPEELVLT